MVRDVYRPLLPCVVLAGRLGLESTASGSYIHPCHVLTGYNENGELGAGTTAHSTVPVAVAGSHSFVEISSGGDHTCAREAGGQVWCWGLNDHFQLAVTGIARSLVPVAIPGANNFTSIDAGGR